MCSKWPDDAVFSLNQSAIPLSLLGPSKFYAELSSLGPAGKYLIVGYPLTWNLEAIYFYCVASTLAILT